MLTTDQKGSIAESAIVHAAIKLGIGVSRPINEGVRYDLVFDLGPKLLRVQCKWALRRADVIVIHCRSARRGPEGMIRRAYTPEEINAFAAYCAEIDRCYFIPLALMSPRSELWLRLTSTRNNQRLRVKWANDFEFAQLDWESLAGP